MGISLLLRVFSHKNGKTHTWFFSQWLKQQPEKTISLYLRTEKRAFFLSFSAPLHPVSSSVRTSHPIRFPSQSRSAQLHTSFNPPLALSLSHTHLYHQYIYTIARKTWQIFKRDLGLKKKTPIEIKGRNLCDCKHMGGITIETS